MIMTEAPSVKKKPCRGALALSAVDSLGLITENEPRRVEGDLEVWEGIQLTDKLTATGFQWCSRSPKVIGYIEPEYVETIIQSLKSS